MLREPWATILNHLFRPYHKDGGGRLLLSQTAQAHLPRDGTAAQSRVGPPGPPTIKTISHRQSYRGNSSAEALPLQVCQVGNQDEPSQDNDHQVILKQDKGQSLETTVDCSQVNNATLLTKCPVLETVISIRNVELGWSNTLVDKTLATQAQE